MTSSRKLQHLETMETVKTATSITTVEHARIDKFFLWLFMFLPGMAALFCIIPLSFGYMSPMAYAIMIGSGVGITAIGGAITRFRPLVDYEELVSVDSHSMRLSEVKNYPNQRKFIGSVPLEFKKHKKVEDVFYRPKKVVDEIRATHIMDETVVWKNGKAYVETTFRETPYTMWIDSFKTLAEQELKMKDKNRTTKMLQP